LSVQTATANGGSRSSLRTGWYPAAREPEAPPRRTPVWGTGQVLGPGQFTSRARPVSRGSHRRDSPIGYVGRGANHSLYRSTGSRVWRSNGHGRPGDRADRPLCVRVPDAARHRRPGKAKGGGDRLSNAAVCTKIGTNDAGAATKREQPRRISAPVVFHHPWWTCPSSPAGSVQSKYRVDFARSRKQVIHSRGGNRSLCGASCTAVFIAEYSSLREALR
jgi:hypothetical protein